MNSLKILITGSHFTPAQAVIEELKKHQNVKIIYVGRKYTQEGDRTPSVESQVLPELGIKFIPITTGRLQRTFTFHTIPSLLKTPIGFIQAMYILLKERPDVVLSFGGYVGVPIVVSAWLLSIPTIIHEQTLVSGLANEISSLFASKIAISFKNNRRKEDKRMILTGNPMRKAVLVAHELKNSKSKLVPEYKKIFDTSIKDKLPIIYITGGNQGSHALNETVGSILPDLTDIACIVHQTGDSKFLDYEKLSEKQQSLIKPERYLAKKWVEADDFAQLLNKIDIAVSRGGINTLYELAFFSIPTLVVPIPFIYKDEQTVNARYFEQLGLAQVLLQRDLTSEKLLLSLKNMIKEYSILKQRAKDASKVAIPDAAKRLALEVLILANESSGRSAIEVS